MNAGISTVAHFKLKRITAKTGKKINTILENTIDSIDLALMPLTSKCEEDGSFLDYIMTVKPYVKPDMVSGSIICGINDNTDALRDSQIDEKFKVLDSIKEQRKLAFQENKVDA